MLKAVESKFETALRSQDIRIGREHAHLQYNDCRAVLQFNVGRDLFDWFFNARTGYRAHFRAHYSCGLRFNDDLIQALRSQIEVGCPNVVRGRELDSEFQDCGEAQIDKKFLIDSLVPELSKVWWCGLLIRQSGGIDLLPLGVGEPKIQLNSGEPWRAFYREGADAWFDVKGAFLPPIGEPYQPKCPIKRTKSLEESGEA